MRTLAAIVLLLAVFGASTQCVADCLTMASLPPCHQHAHGKNSASEPCKHLQPVADTPAVGSPAAEIPALAEAAYQLVAQESAPPDNVQLSFSVLRL